MKTSLRRLFNYWLPPGVNDTSPVLNPLVDLAVKINASCLAMLSGGEIDWDEIKRDSEEWAKLVEMARQPPPVPYAWCEDRYVLVNCSWPPPRQRTPKSTSPSADQTLAPSAETKC